jgi:Uncharacterized protein conserved in bacteria (DUF2334)
MFTAPSSAPLMAEAATPAAPARAPWLPEGRDAAVIFSIDDIHPGRSTDAYEAGGDLEKGALGHVQWLLERHPQLRVTLFTTPDWREISPIPTRTALARIPRVRDRVMLARILRRGTMRLDRHPEFVQYLRALPRTEIGLHGLHHVHPGRLIHVEFQAQDRETCAEMLRQGLAIFRDAGLPAPRGMCPPGWHIHEPLALAMADAGLEYVASGRDLSTPISSGATMAGSGLRGGPMLHPAPAFDGRLMHVPSNFSATSPVDRAMEIVRAGGLLGIKAHIIKQAMGHVALDGLDLLFRNYLDVVLCTLEDRFGDRLWFATVADVAERARAAAAQPSPSQGA